MNHRTRLDWMFFWPCLFKLNAMRHERVVLKGQLKHVPGPGWSMQFGLFVFIQRKWELDKLFLTKILDHFRDVKNTAQLLLFPEGTDLTPFTKTRSDAFAEKNGLPKFNYVLHPRTTGFTFLAQHMKKNGTLDAIYDITIGYPVNIPQNELSLFKGDFPQEVHYHIKRNPCHQIPDTEKGLVSWCQERWSEKEERLEQFYAQKHFSEPQTVSPDSRNLQSFFTVISWLVLLFFQVWMLVNFSLIRWYALFALATMLFIDLRLGGLDNFQIDTYNKLFRAKND
ncbi:lysocardiolipin acyltransferase 1-like isoform X2 [Lineus longissimus]